MSTLSDALAAFRICAKAEGMSPKSIDGRAKCVGYFASFLGCDPELSKIGANDLRRFILALQESQKYQKHPYKPHYREKISPTSIATYTREIKAFFSYLAREELMNSLTPTLWRMREKAEELRRIPNLPGYIDQPTVTMTNKIDNFNSYLKGYIERIRNLIPKEALEEERKALEYGKQQSLI